MEVYVTVGLIRNSGLQYIAITKSKFSKNLKLLSSSLKATLLAEEGFRMLQYRQQKLNNGVVQCKPKYNTSTYLSA